MITDSTWPADLDQRAAVDMRLSFPPRLRVGTPMVEASRRGERAKWPEVPTTAAERRAVYLLESGKMEQYFTEFGS